MGDPLRFDGQRLRILIERHLLYTGSARARLLLDDWDNTLAAFVKVTPKRLPPRPARTQGRARSRPHGRGGVASALVDGHARGQLVSSGTGSGSLDARFAESETCAVAEPG